MGNLNVGQNGKFNKEKAIKYKSLTSSPNKKDNFNIVIQNKINDRRKVLKPVVGRIPQNFNKLL